MSTRDQVKAVLAFIAAVYPNWDISGALVDVWHAVLSKHDPDTLRAAAIQFLSQHAEFPPKPGQINVLAEKIASPHLHRSAAAAMALGDDPIAEYAWNVVERTLAWDSSHQYRSPEDLAQARQIHEGKRQKLFKEIYESTQAGERMNEAKKQAALPILDNVKALIGTTVKAIDMKHRLPHEPTFSE